MFCFLKRQRKFSPSALSCYVKNTNDAVTVKSVNKEAFLFQLIHI